MHPSCLRSAVERRDAEGTTDQEAAWNVAGDQETPTLGLLCGCLGCPSPFAGAGRASFFRTNHSRFNP